VHQDSIQKKSRLKDSPTGFYEKIDEACNVWVNWESEWLLATMCTLRF
jgi:hypothetical protein